MNRYIYASIALASQLTFLGTTAYSQVSPEVAAQCKEARDYLGCVKAFTTSPVDSGDSDLRDLRNAMKQVSSRLGSGISLQDSTNIFQVLLDKHAVLSDKNHETLAYQGATISIDLFNIMRNYWSETIRSGSRYESMKIYSTATCNRMNALIESFNSTIGKQVIGGGHKIGLMGCSLNSGSFGVVPLMNRYIAGLLKDASSSPSIVQEYSQKLKEAKRIAALGPWQRYLDKNPGMAQWAKANPGLVEAKKIEYVRKYGSDPVQMPEVPASMVRFEGTKLEAYIGK